MSCCIVLYSIVSYCIVLYANLQSWKGLHFLKDHKSLAENGMLKKIKVVVVLSWIKKNRYNICNRLRQILFSQISLGSLSLLLLYEFKSE